MDTTQWYVDLFSYTLDAKESYVLFYFILLLTDANIFFRIHSLLLDDSDIVFPFKNCEMDVRPTRTIKTPATPLNFVELYESVRTLIKLIKMSL